MNNLTYNNVIFLIIKAILLLKFVAQDLCWLKNEYFPGYFSGSHLP